MRWPVVRTIWFREVRDQLRDRRTLFMILVLPLLLYPALGMAFTQFTVVLVERPVTVGIANYELLDIDANGLPKLLGDDGMFAPSLYKDNQKARILLKVVVEPKQALETKLAQGD